MVPLTFWTLAALMVAAAVLVVLLADPFRSALCLAVASTCLGALYITLDARFLGVVQILVYTGAVIVLFLFIIMLLGLRGERPPQARLPAALGAGLVAGILLQQLGAALGGSALAARALPELGPGAADGARILGTVIFTRFNLPLQLAAGILLIAVIGAIVLGKRDLK